jgi:hypothetical protein
MKSENSNAMNAERNAKENMTFLITFRPIRMSEALIAQPVGRHSKVRNI